MYKLKTGHWMGPKRRHPIIRLSKSGRFWIVGLLGAVSWVPSNGQFSAYTFVSQSVAAFRNIYFQQIKGNARLYQGTKYDVNDKTADGFPYFQADVIRAGS